MSSFPLSDTLPLMARLSLPVPAMICRLAILAALPLNDVNVSASAPSVAVVLMIKVGVSKTASVSKAMPPLVPEMMMAGML